MTDSTNSSAHGWPAVLPAAAWIIAGLVIVLLLLLCLRWVYRKYRVRQAWKLIKTEREYNKRAFARAAELLDTQARQWRTNLAMLERAQIAADAALEGGSGLMTWAFEAPEFPESHWQDVLRSGATVLMQPQQVREVEELYVDLNTLRASTAALTAAVESARGSIQSLPQHPGPTQLTEPIALARAVMSAHLRFHADMQRFQQLHTDFVPVPAVQELINVEQHE